MGTNQVADGRMETMEPIAKRKDVPANAGYEAGGPMNNVIGNSCKGLCRVAQRPILTRALNIDYFTC